MLRSLYVTILVAGLSLAGLATPSLAERMRGTVLARTSHTLSVLSSDGATRVFRRAGDLRVLGEADRWHEIRRGDSVKVRFDRRHRQQVADRIHVVDGPLFKSHPDQRRLVARVTHVSPRGLGVVAANGKALRIHTNRHTLRFDRGDGQRLRPGDRVELVLASHERRHAQRAVPQVQWRTERLALQVRRLDARSAQHAAADCTRNGTRVARADLDGRRRGAPRR